MLYKEIIAVCSEIDTKHKYAVWAEHRIAEYEADGTHSNARAIKGSSPAVCQFIIPDTKVQCCPAIVARRYNSFSHRTD
jgi:hypothetical protein